MRNSQNHTGRAGIRKWRIPALLLFAAAILALARILNLASVLRESLAWISRLGPWGPAAFVLLYVVCTLLFIPGSILTLGAGAVFGIAWGTVYVSVGSTLGSILAYLIGRGVARGWIEGKIHARRKFEAISRAVAREGWKIVGLLRLSPLFPFNLLNYALGLTRISFRDYALASWIGMLPGTLMYVYLGSLAGSLAGLDSGRQARTPAQWVLYGVGLLATVAVTLFVTRIAKKELDREIR